MSILTQINNPERVFLSLLFLLISNFCYAEKVIDWTAGATITDDIVNVETDGTRNYRIRIHGDIKMTGFIQVGDDNASTKTTCIVEIADDVSGSVTLKTPTVQERIILKDMHILFFVSVKAAC